jgi:hypothetical protein
MYSVENNNVFIALLAASFSRYDHHQTIAITYLLIYLLTPWRTASVVWWLACWPLVPEFAGSIPTSACLPSEGKYNNLSHVPTLGHVKNPSFCGELRAAG